MSLTKTKEFITALGIAYKQAGNNAYFGNGFYEGVLWAEQNPVNKIVRQGDQPVQNGDIVDFLDYVNDFANYVYDIEISDSHHETVANFIMNIQSKVPDIKSRFDA